MKGRCKMAAKKYRKKPIVVDAIPWTGKNTAEVIGFCPELLKIRDGRKLAYLFLPHQHYYLTEKIYKNYWVLKNSVGNFCCCRPDNFKADYEPLPKD